MPSMKHLILILLVFVGACASQPLPAIGNALEASNHAFEKADAAYAVLCRPPVPTELAKRCHDLDDALIELRSGLNAATAVYSTVNDVAEEASK